MKEIRTNVLLLALFGIFLCLGMSFFLEDDQYLIGIAGGIVGAIAATMKELINPPQPPDPPSVPANTVDKILDTFGVMIPKHSDDQQ